MQSEKRAMSMLRRLSFLLFLAGIICFVAGVLNGEAEVGFVLIFPFIIGSGLLSLLGVLLLFFGMLLYIGGFFHDNLRDHTVVDNEISHESSKPKLRGGGVILIGPLPIIFGTSWKMTLVALVITIIILGGVYLALSVF